MLKSGLGRPIVEVFRSITITHIPGRTPLNERAVRRRGRYLHNTQQTQETNIHALSGTRTRDLSNQADSDLQLQQHGHRDRLRYLLLTYFAYQTSVRPVYPLLIFP